MRIAFISDVHGNIQALNNCFNFLRFQQIDHTYFLGDSIGYLPYGLEVIDFLHEEKVTCIMGNHEAMLLGKISERDGNSGVYKLDNILKNISDQQLTFIKSWEQQIILNSGGKKIVLLHGSPSNPLEGYLYPNTDFSIFDEFDFDVLISGHTHLPMIKYHNCKIYINPGSVGLPRDIGNLSSLCVIDTKEFNVNIFRIPFDVEILLNSSPANTIHSATINCLSRMNSKYEGTLII